MKATATYNNDDTVMIMLEPETDQEIQLLCATYLKMTPTEFDVVAMDATSFHEDDKTIIGITADPEGRVMELDRRGHPDWEIRLWKREKERDPREAGDDDGKEYGHPGDSLKGRD